MRVTYDWEDNAGDNYQFEAEVHPIDRNRITIVSIRSGDVDIDLDDFDDEELIDIRLAAKHAAQELDNSEDPLTDEDEDNDESNFDNY